MSKSRGKSETTRGSTQGNQPTQSATETHLASSARIEWGIAFGVVVLLLAYLTIFFSASRSRLLLIAHVLMPDELVRQWADDHWSQSHFLDRGPILLCGSAILLGGYFLGRVFLRITRVDKSLTNLERTLFSIGVGLQIQSLLTLLGGLMPLPKSALVFVLWWAIAAVTLAVLWWQRKLRYEPDASILNTANATEPQLSSKLVLAATWSLRIYVGLCSLSILLGAMLPPRDFDVREYHLQVPKEWSESGGVNFLPHNVYGNMPLGAEIHAVAATQLMPAGPRSWWWGALTGKLIMASYGPLTALAIYAMGKRYLSPQAGLAAAALYVSSPWVIHVSINGLNEAVLGYYLFAAANMLLIRSNQVRSVIVAGFLAGAAASTKYTGVVFVILPLAVLTMLLYVEFPRRNFAKGAYCAAAFVLIAALSCSLWYGKNWVVAGNPTYPLMSGVFGGRTRTPEKVARWNQAHQPLGFTMAKLADSAEHVLWKSDFQNPLTIPLVVLGMVGNAIALRNRKSAGESPPQNFLSSNLPLIAIIALLLFFIAGWWLFTHRLDRFLVPAIPLAALLAGAGVEYSRKKPLQYVVVGLMVVGLTYNLLMAASPFVGDNRWFVALEKLRTDEPKSKQHVSRVKAAHRWLNQNVKPEEGVLCVADAAVFDLEMPVFYNTCFDDCLLVNWTEGKTTAAQKVEFRSRKVAYVYFDRNEYGRYTGNGNYGYDPRFSPELLDELLRQGVLKPPLPDSPPQIYPVSP